MSKLDFPRYKHRLIEYLDMTGIKAVKNVSFICPLHNDTNASAIVNDDNTLHCFGCGFHGDIFDYVGKQAGIIDAGERFRAVASAFGDLQDGGGLKPWMPTEEEIAERNKPKAPEFVPDTEAMETLDKYLELIKPYYHDELAAFFTFRKMSPELIEKCINQVSYWPGYKAVLSEGVEIDTLADAGIPEKAFAPAGIIVRLAVGYKLHYASSAGDGKTIKRGSHASRAFPFPNMPDAPADCPVILCEGELDQITAIAAGFENVRSIGGINGLSEKGASCLIGRLVTIAMDNDTEGINSVEHISKIVKTAKPASILYIDYSQNSDAIGEKDIDDLVKHGKDYVFKHLIESAVRMEESNNEDGTENTGRGIELVSGSGSQSGNDGNTTGAICRWNSESTGEIRGAGTVPKVDNSVLLNTRADTSEPVAYSEIPFQFLGYDNSTYYVMPKSQNIPKSIGWGDKSIGDKLFELAPRSWWELYFTKTGFDRKGEPIEIFDKESACDWFRIESTKKGMFDDEHLLGIGAHIDDKAVVINTGRAIVTPDGSIENYEGYSGKNVYVRSKVELIIGEKPWAESDGANLLTQLKTFSFEQNISYPVILGWCAIAPWSSCLYRRPHIWITAKGGTGKSYLLNDLIKPIIGEHCLFSEGGTTEAAIRQTVRSDCRPIILDEFEANKKYDLVSLDNILGLARSAYGGERKIKGSSSQKAISFATKMSFCFASVNINLSDAATKSRIAICRMKPSTGKMKSIKNPDGLRGRMFLRLEELITNIEKCHDAMEDLGFDSRTADTYSPLFAGYWMTLSDLPFGDSSTQKNEALLKSIFDALSQIDMGNEKENDEEKILEKILQKRIRISETNEEKTISEMLTEHAMNGSGLRDLKYGAQVQLYGLRRMIGTDSMGCGGREVLALSCTSDEISKILENTAFTNYREVLKRNPAFVNMKPVYIGKLSQSAIILDWKMIEEKYFKEG